MGRKVRGPKDDELTMSPVCDAAKRTCRYHMGTVAVTSLIIAIIQMIRLAVTYLEKTTQGDPPNPLQKCVFCLLKCCLWWLECCLDKLNKDSLVILMYPNNPNKLNSPDNLKKLKEP